MANSRRSSKKSTLVTEFPQPATPATAADVPPEFQESAEQAEPAAEPAKPIGRPLGRPPKSKLNGLPNDGNFFARVAAIPQEQWDAQKVYLYLYIIEPLCNLKQSGGRSYLNRYSQPVKDEHQIAVEYGSGRYRLMLTYARTSAADKGEIAQYDFEIYNPQYPPKVPRAAWINDSRNQKWEALLPKEPPASQAGSLVDAMKVYGEIRREVRDELDDDEPVVLQSTSTSEVLATMKAAKDLFSQPASTAAPAKDPLEIAVALATTMMQMKADNPVIDMYREELKALRDEMKEERAANRAAAEKAPTTAPKGLLEQLTELAGPAEKGELVKKVLGLAFGNATEAVRAGRTTGLDVTRDIATKFFESDLATGVGQWLASVAQRNAGPPPPMNGGPQLQPQPTDEFGAFLQNVLNPALLRHYIQGLTGTDFAGWLYDGYPDRLAQLQQFTHPRLPGLQGAAAIVQAYKNTPNMWPSLSSRGEPEFIEFANQFCQWKPTEEPIDAEVIEPAAEQKEEGPERI